MNTNHFIGGYRLSDEEYDDLVSIPLIDLFCYLRGLISREKSSGRLKTPNRFAAHAWDAVIYNNYVYHTIATEIENFLTSNIQVYGTAAEQMVADSSGSHEDYPDVKRWLKNHLSQIVIIDILIRKVEMKMQTERTVQLTDLMVQLHGLKSRCQPLYSSLMDCQCAVL